jgi:hypothetical protein
MKVGELIAELQKYPEDMEVTVGKDPIISVEPLPYYYDSRYFTTVGKWPNETALIFPKENHLMLRSNSLEDFLFDDPELPVIDAPERYLEYIEKYREEGRKIV